VVNGTDPWTYPLSLLPSLVPGAGDGKGWPDNEKITVNTRVTDLVGNLSPMTTREFHWDSSLPEASIAAPAAYYMAAVNAISGTALDPNSALVPLGNGSGVKDVEVAIYNNHPAIRAWWNHGGWGSALPYWIKASSSLEIAPPDGAAWSLDSSTIAFNQGAEHSVNVRAVDWANNRTVPVSSFTFVYDA